ncbi:unnamed protein product [Rotaria sp. Silwood2]|nr:unnamed protein product [Rotaria sp. Silwood2]
MIIVKLIMNAGLLVVLIFLCLTGNSTTAISVQIDTGISQRTTASLGLVGDTADVNTTTVGGTVLIGGGSNVDEAFQWMIKKAGGDDFVVLRASGTDAYNSYTT